jgi:hypothetical protein
MLDKLTEAMSVYHLQEYAILENDGGILEYVTWEINKSNKKLSWIKGQAIILNNILCITGITSEGEEESVRTEQEVDNQLDEFQKWDKTKYYCVVLSSGQASLPRYCSTGQYVKKGTEEYSALQQMFGEKGVSLPGQSEI